VNQKRSALFKFSDPLPISSRGNSSDVDPFDSVPFDYKGCATCCTIRVIATAPEALMLARYVRAADAALKQAGRIAEADSATHGLDERQRVALRRRCPFIAKGSASFTWRGRLPAGGTPPTTSAPARTPLPAVSTASRFPCLT
jgi:hypothetical protein